MPDISSVIVHWVSYSLLLTPSIKQENIPSPNAERKEQRKSLFLGTCHELYIMLSPFTYFIYSKSALYHRAFWDGGDVLYLWMSKMVLILALSSY